MMRNPNRRIEPLPEEFRSDEEAADFWDKHSITDYEEFLEPVELEADIQRRHFEIEVDSAPTECPEECGRCPVA
jgi:hypothetical protein